MKILVVSQHYYPEQFRITDICEELVRRGHEVTVLTGLPNYPMGYIFDGYKGAKGKKHRDEIIGGVRVLRCFTIGRRKGIFFRALNYFSFMFSSSFRAARMKEEFDVVFSNQSSPVMMANAGGVYKKKHKVPFLLYCLDLWPESMTVWGVKRGSFLYNIFHRISERIYKSADKIMITSRSFADYFRDEFGIDETVYMPQYAETIFTPEECKKQPNGTVDLMFAGNVGTAQSVETILAAAEQTKEVPNLRWHIVGDGSSLEALKACAAEKHLDSVIFHGRRPLDDMPAYYAMADAMLVTLKKDPVINLTLPGKVQTYMAAGKPILGAIDGETPLIVNAAGCGICVPGEDADALARAAVSFALSSDREVFASRSAAYCASHFSRDGFFEKLEEEMARAVASVKKEEISI